MTEERTRQNEQDAKAVFDAQWERLKKMAEDATFDEAVDEVKAKTRAMGDSLSVEEFIEPQKGPDKDEIRRIINRSMVSPGKREESEDEGSRRRWLRGSRAEEEPVQEPEPQKDAFAITEEVAAEIAAASEAMGAVGDALAEAEDEGTESGRRRESRGMVSDGAKMIIKDVVIACAIALAISAFVRPTIVRETSMEPTVRPNDYLIMSRQAYTFGEVERGDIIIFQSELKLDETHNKLLIKRVIGLPGDTITIADGLVYLNGEALTEDYIAEGGTVGQVQDLVVPEGQVFVMGDHRSVSVDSRALGCIDQEDIEGKAVFRLYPFGEFGRLK